ncbi:MAG: mechanosensitive ion channel [Acidilobaceae archaeon]
MNISELIQAIGGYSYLIFTVTGIILILLASFISYSIASRILFRLRVRRLLDKSIEEALRLVIALLIAAIALPLVLSLLFSIPYGLLVSVSLLVLLLVSLILAGREYLANILSYLLVSVSGVVREGEYVRIDLQSNSYEGRVLLSKGEYLALQTDHGHIIYIPYSKLHSSTIIKLASAIINLRVRIKGENIEVDRVVKDVENAIANCKFIDRNSISVKISGVSEENSTRVLTLLVEARTLNLRNIDKAREELIETLVENLPYEASLSISRGE